MRKLAIFALSVIVISGASLVSGDSEARFLEPLEGVSSAGPAARPAAATRGEAQDAEPTGDERLRGAWELVAAETVTPDGSVRPYTTQESFLLFSDGYYSMNWASGAEESSPYAERFQPTDAEKLDRYNRLLVNAGTYAASDGKLVIEPRFALVPEYVGGYGEFDYEVDDDTLELHWKTILDVDGVPDPWTAQGYSYRYTFVRIEPSPPTR